MGHQWPQPDTGRTPDSFACGLVCRLHEGVAGRAKVRPLLAYDAPTARLLALLRARLRDRQCPHARVGWERRHRPIACMAGGSSGGGAARTGPRSAHPEPGTHRTSAYAACNPPRRP